MIVDTSAVIAILFNEPEKAEFSRKLSTSGDHQISAGSWIELAAVQVRSNQHFRKALEALIAESGINIAPTTVEQARMGAEAYHRYGQGSGHPARLNFGDCFAYALSKATGEALLFKGDDFGHTDVLAA